MKLILSLIIITLQPLFAAEMAEAQEKLEALSLDESIQKRLIDETGIEPKQAAEVLETLADPESNIDKLLDYYKYYKEETPVKEMLVEPLNKHNLLVILTQLLQHNLKEEIMRSEYLPPLIGFCLHLNRPEAGYINSSMKETIISSIIPFIEEKEKDQNQ